MYALNDLDGTVSFFTEEKILEEYWDYWHEEMQKAILRPNCSAYGRPELITKDNCIVDWVVVNWAYKV